jgi:hypothetical protein
LLGFSYISAKKIYSRIAMATAGILNFCGFVHGFQKVNPKPHSRWTKRAILF